MAKNGLSKITMHWSVDKGVMNTSAAKHYHFSTDKNGKQHSGNLRPEANANTSDGNYVAHCRGFNTGNIGMAVLGMHGAEEKKTAGQYKLNQNQVEAFCEQVADIADIYDIPVSQKTIFTHAEVQSVHGVRQNGKWDIMWLPELGFCSAKEGGDYLRAKISEYKNKAIMTPMPLIAVKKRGWFYKLLNFLMSLEK